MKPIYAIHEHELREDVDAEEYESEVQKALDHMRIPGLVKAIHLKGFKGKRANKYSVLWVFADEKSLEDNFGTTENPKMPSDWVHYENGVLAKFLDRHPDTIDYTDYRIVREFKF